MENVRVRAVLRPVGLFVLSAGAYWAVLLGVVPFALDVPIVFAVIAGATALGAVKIGARTPALTAGVAALGFMLASMQLGGLLSVSGKALLIGGALATLGVLGYAVSMVYHIGTRVYSTNPA